MNLTRYSFAESPNGIRTVFTSPVLVTGSTPVFRNGALQQQGLLSAGADYFFSGFVVTFYVAPGSGDSLALLQDTTLFVGNFIQAPNGIRTAFTSPVALTPADLVFRNGVILPSTAYSVSGFTVTFIVAPSTGDDLQLLQDTALTQYALTPLPNGSVTVFTAPIVVTANSVLFRNGELFGAADYSYSGTQITFFVAPGSGDGLALFQTTPTSIPVPASIAYPGYGSSLSMSLDGGLTFTRIAQLKSFVPLGSKTTMVDATTITDPDNFTRPLAVRVDAGELDMEGVLIPSNVSQLNLGVAQENLELNYYLATLTDGTRYIFQAYVLEYVPFEVKVKLAMLFRAKLTIVGGGLFRPLVPVPLLGAFDPAAFDSGGFDA